MTEVQNAGMVKKYNTALDVKTDTKKQREAAIMNGTIGETVSFWTVAKALHATKAAINAKDPEYNIVKTDKNGEDIYKGDSKVPEIITQTFSKYCEETFTEAGLSRSRREEMITSYEQILFLQLAGFDVENLPKTVQQGTLLAKWDNAEKAEVWQNFLDTLDMSVLKIAKVVTEDSEEAESKEDGISEDIESEDLKPLEFFLQQAIDRCKDREVESPEMAALLAEELIRLIDPLTHTVEEVEEEA